MEKEGKPRRCSGLVARRNHLHGRNLQEGGEAYVREGRVAVTGVHRSVPLLEAMGLDAKDRENHLSLEKKAACTYCGYGALCGEKWEALA